MEEEQNQKETPQQTSKVDWFKLSLASIAIGVFILSLISVVLLNNIRNSVSGEGYVYNLVNQLSSRIDALRVAMINNNDDQTADIKSSSKSMNDQQTNAIVDSQKQLDKNDADRITKIEKQLAMMADDQVVLEEEVLASKRIVENLNNRLTKEGVKVKKLPTATPWELIPDSMKQINNLSDPRVDEWQPNCVRDRHNNSTVCYVRID